MGFAIEREKEFDFIKASCAIMVVLHHSIHYYTEIVTGSVAFDVMIALLKTCHVPLFLIAAGYFCHEQTISTFYQKKIKRIWIPFVVFSILKLVYSMFISSEFSHGGASIVSRIKYSLLVGTQYWFIYAILGMYLIAPLFWTKKNGVHSNGMIALIVSYAIICVLTVYTEVLGHSLPMYFQFGLAIFYVPYFAFGCFLRQNKDAWKSFYNNHYKGICIASTMIILAFLIIYTFNPRIWVFPMVFFVSVSCFNDLYFLVGKVKEGNKVLNTISKYSLQIMFLDSFYRVVIFKIFRAVGMTNPIIIFLATIITVFLCVVTCEVVEKIRFARVLFGL